MDSVYDAVRGTGTVLPRGLCIKAAGSEACGEVSCVMCRDDRCRQGGKDAVLCCRLYVSRLAAKPMKRLAMSYFLLQLRDDGVGTALRVGWSGLGCYCLTLTP